MSRPRGSHPRTRGAVLVAAAVLASGCTGTSTEAPGATAAATAPGVVLPTASGSSDAYEVASVLGHLASDGRFGILLGILEEHEPGRFLQELGRVPWRHTFFAPTDEAFETLDPTTIAQLLDDPDLLLRVLRYHVVPSRPRVTSDLGPGSLATLSGPLEVTQSGTRTVVGGVPIAEPDVSVAGSVLHIVEQLIVPCTDPLVRDRDLACVEATTEPEAEALGTVGPAEAETMTIAEVLRTDERFARFRDLVERTETPVAENILAVWDFDAERMGEDRDGVTVFVPTDAAFAALDADLLAVIDDPGDNDLLYGLFGHHYVHRLYPSDDFDAGPQQTWRRSSSGPVELTLDPLAWGGQPIVQTDIRTTNGIIHVIGGVVIPDELAAAADRRG